jgi:(2R)-ethylmalonyl-CoA mutase
MRAVFGEYRAPTGVGGARPQIDQRRLADVRARVDRLTASLRRRPKMLVGKPGLDGHSNGAEQIALCARDCGFEVVYDGIRLTPARIAAAALEEGVHVVGLSILSGSHRAQVAEVLARLRAEGLDDLPVVVGGIIPPEDAAQLRAAGVASVFTPKDYDLAAVMAEIVGVLEERKDQAA